MPHGPDDPSELVRHGDGGFIVAATIADRYCPRMQARERLGVAAMTLRRHEHGARTMRKQTAVIDITALADPAEMPSLPA